jgi:aspartate ammonia-lyase
VQHTYNRNWKGEERCERNIEKSLRILQNWHQLIYVSNICIKKRSLNKKKSVPKVIIFKSQKLKSKEKIRKIVRGEKLLYVGPRQKKEKKQRRKQWR